MMTWPEEGPSDRRSIYSRHECVAIVTSMRKCLRISVAAVVKSIPIGTTPTTTSTTTIHIFPVSCISIALSDGKITFSQLDKAKTFEIPDLWVKRSQRQSEM